MERIGLPDLTDGSFRLVKYPYNPYNPWSKTITLSNHLYADNHFMIYQLMNDIGMDAG